MLSKQSLKTLICNKKIIFLKIKREKMEFIIRNSI